MSSLSSKKKLMRRMVLSPPAIDSSSPGLFDSLQDKILSYQTLHNLNLQKTYSHFLEIGNSPSLKASVSVIKPSSRVRKEVRQSVNSLSLNDTKLMRKLMKSIKEYQRTLEDEEEGSHLRNTEGTLVRNFSLAKFVLQDTFEAFRGAVLALLVRNPQQETVKTLFQKEQDVAKFHKKCDALKENVTEVLAFMERERDIAKGFEKSAVMRKNAFMKPFEKQMLRSMVRTSHGFSIDYKSKIDEAFGLRRHDAVGLNFLRSEEDDTPAVMEDSIKLEIFGNNGNNNRAAISFFNTEENNERREEMGLGLNSPKQQKPNLQFLLENSQILARKNSSKLQALKENYDLFSTRLISLVHSLNMRELYVYLMLLHSKLCVEFKEQHKAIAILRQAKSISRELGFSYYRLKCYEKLGKAFQALKNFKLALRFFLKMLEAAFICDAEHKELQAYDLIGLQFYYQGKTDIAEFFHKRLLNGETEPEDSNLRTIAKRRFLNRSKTANYILPSYIAARSTGLNYETMENDSSEGEEEGDLKIEELMSKYRDRDSYWHLVMKKKPKNGLTGPVNLKDVLERANKNIRPSRNERVASLDIKKFHLQKRVMAAASPGASGKPGLLRFNHLSPNRNFSKPNVYEFKMNKLSKEDNLKLTKKVGLLSDRLLERLLHKFQGLFEKLRNNLRVSLMQVEFYSTKLRDSTSGRKKGLLCSPLLHKTVGSSLKKFLRSSLKAPKRSIDKLC